MKALLRIVVLSSLLGTSSCLAVEQSIPRTLNVRVVDEAGEPVQGAESKIGFSFVGSTRGLTDEGGQLSHTGRQTGTWFVQIEKKGYYETSGTGPMAAPPGLVEVVLKRKIDPVAMVVGRVPGGVLPVSGNEVGYDLKKADWLPPYGKGVVADIYLKGEVHDYSYPDSVSSEMSFDGYTIMRVAGEADGIIIKDLPVPKDSDEPQSELKSVQQAPEGGYGRKEIVQKGAYFLGDPVSVHPHKNYLILRTRTVLDENGEIVSAHYSKVYEPLGIGATRQSYDTKGGQLGISGLYYFNPRPNSRSLEFNRENLHSDPPIGNLPY